MSNEMAENSAKIIKRMDFNTQAHSKKRCNCERFQERMEELFEDMKGTMQQENKVLRETMQQENKVLRDQLQIAMEAIVDMKVVVEQLNRQRAAEMPITIKFPLISGQQLEEINAEINEDNRANYIKSMSNLLKPAGVIKNLKFILNDAVVQEYNVDGIDGKKSLKRLNNFYCTLIESIPIDDGSETPHKQLRKAIQLQKNRFNKAKSVHKNKNKNYHDDDDVI